MPVSVIFWVFLIIALITAFFTLLLRVRSGAGAPPGQAEAGQEAPQAPAASQPETPPAPPPRGREPAVGPAEAPPQGTPQEQPPAQRATEQPPASPPAPAERPPQIRDRSVYFMQAQRGGAELLLAKASRRFGVSDSPLLDCINALLAGPTAEERNRGLLSFIPPETRIIGAEVRGSTAYLNFNEEFQYNTSGREGSAAQVRQIVWTATEFPNINDVQILIEGKRVDFLNEGVLIGSPIGR